MLCESTEFYQNDSRFPCEQSDEVMFENLLFFHDQLDYNVKRAIAMSIYPHLSIGCGISAIKGSFINVYYTNLYKLSMPN